MTVDLSNYKPSSELLKKIPPQMAWFYRILPLKCDGNSFEIACPAGMPRSKREEVRVALACPVSFVEISPNEIDSLLPETYGLGADVLAQMEQTQGRSKEKEPVEVFDIEVSEEASISKWVNHLFRDAIEKNASDIHIEPLGKNLRVRYRIDGVLAEARVAETLHNISLNLISRIKIMAGLDISERRHPQDGRIKIKKGNESLSVRVSVLPSVSGEAIVLRILRPLSVFELEELGFDETSLGIIRHALNRENGMILATGPTGAGKSTTLYACLKKLNQIEEKIITVEDPVEYRLKGAIQMQVHEKIGFTFSTALRAILRHDPDILMLGEIRDKETAEIAVRAALTGHLVLSTLHTNDAPSVITRLVEMGIEPYLIAASLNLVISQRLVRMLNPVSTGAEPGYKGRTAVYEVMQVTPKLRDCILERIYGTELRRIALEEGMVSLEQSARRLVETGITTDTEVSAFF
ncbi:MAG: GspE/PulE family protein [Candidatus Omnitrophota bacterium]|jgi:type II secretory ATPase GspE/PulE/Tfp pilus assembly ATPase PilB-like protein